MSKIGISQRKPEQTGHRGSSGGGAFGAVGGAIVGSAFGAGGMAAGSTIGGFIGSKIDKPVTDTRQAIQRRMATAQEGVSGASNDHKTQFLNSIEALKQTNDENLIRKYAPALAQGLAAATIKGGQA